MTQTVPQLIVTLNTIITAAAVLSTKLSSTISRLTIIVSSDASQSFGTLSKVTSILSTASTTTTHAASEVTSQNIITTETLAFIDKAANSIFTAITDSVTHFTEVLGPIVTGLVLNAVKGVVQATYRLIQVGFRLYIKSTVVDRTVSNTLTVILVDLLAAGFELVKIVEGIVTVVVGTIATTSNLVIEAVNALAVVLSATLLTVLTSTSKGAELFQGLSQEGLQAVTIVTATAAFAANSVNDLVSQMSSSVTSDSDAASSLKDNISKIDSTLKAVKDSFSNRLKIISKVNLSA